MSLLKNTGLLTSLTIKHKIWAGFVLLLIILAVVALYPVFSLNSIQKKITGIVQGNQAAVIASEELAKSINKASTYLGFYLMSLEDHHKNEFDKVLVTINEQISALENSPVIQSNEESRQLVHSITSDVRKIKEFGPKAEELVKDNAKNFPALAYAAQNLNPIGQQMLQITTGMILSEGEEDANKKRKQLLLDIEDLRYGWANVMNAIRSYLLFGFDVALRQVDDYVGSSGKFLEKIKAQEDILTLDQADGIERFSSLYNQYLQALKKLADFKSEGKWRIDAYLVRTQIGPLFNDVIEKLDKLVQVEKEAIDTTSNELLGTVSTTTAFVTTLLFIGLLAGLTVAWLISRMIIGPLQQAVSAMHDIAEGEGDLTRRLDESGNDEIAQLALGFNKFAGKIQTLVGQVTGFTSQLASATNEMSAITEQTNIGAKRQQQDTDQVVSAVNEMMSSVQEVARSAAEAAGAAQHADDETANGQTVVSNTVKSINALAGEVERAAEVIHRLGKDSENIGSVLDVIKGIAEQTNLLALNAAIEAARAGEQGRGFAVVADEVRTLASRTQQSTQEIQEMIERLQTGAREAVTVMEEGRNMAKTSVDQAAKAGSSLDVIAGAVSTINTMNTQIASAAEEQSSVTDEINRSIHNISEVCDQTAEGAQQTARASEELANLAVELQGLLQQFRIS